MIQITEESFLSALYRAFFSREPDAASFCYLQTLKDSQHLESTIADVVRSLASSKEFDLRRDLGRSRNRLSQEEHAAVFVANDNVYDQTLAFLESFFQNSPGIDLFCIPYADDIDRIGELADIYGFRFHTDFGLAQIDRISSMIYGTPNNRLRKIGAFTLGVQEFLSLDVDIIVLKDLKPFFGYIGGFCDLLYTDVSNGGSYITRDSVFVKDSLEINTGAYVSSKNSVAFSLFTSTLEALVDEYKRIAFTLNDDQPLINYILDTQKKRVRHLEDAGVPYSSRNWYLHEGFEQNGQDVIDCVTGKTVALIHYAGAGRDIRKTAPFGDLYHHYLTMGQERVMRYQKSKRGIVA